MATGIGQAGWNEARPVEPEKDPGGQRMQAEAPAGEGAILQPHTSTAPLHWCGHRPHRSETRKKNIQNGARCCRGMLITQNGIQVQVCTWQSWHGFYNRHSLYTRHSHGAGLLQVAPDTQLPVVVASPALDPATRLDRARVVGPQCDCGGGDACDHWES